MPVELLHDFNTKKTKIWEILFVKYFENLLILAFEVNLVIENCPKNCTFCQIFESPVMPEPSMHCVLAECI